MKVIDELVEQNENAVVEGVHLTVDFLMIVMKKYPFCIPFVVFIKNKEKHKERFAVRSKQMTLDPRYNKYVECFESIRIIHKFFVRSAEKSLIPRIDNTNVDKSLGLIHSTIVRCLRKIVKGESLIDESTNKATNLCQEFNAVSKSGLSSTEAQKIIKSKVNKGEIFKRFFGEQAEPVVADAQPSPTADEEPKRVHSFDEGEVEQIKKENEAAAEKVAAEQPENVPFGLDALLKKSDGPRRSIPSNTNVPQTAEEGQASHGQETLSGGMMRSPKPLPSPHVPAMVQDIHGEELLPPAADPGVQGEDGKNVAAQEEDLKIGEKPLKTSKSSENLLDEANKKKKVKFARDVVVDRPKRPADTDTNTAGDEDKQSVVSGMCSVYSGSIEVNTHGIIPFCVIRTRRS